MDNRKDVWRAVDAHKDRLIALSDRVWGMPEVCYTEARSSAEHLAELNHQGFRVTERIAGIPTALMGEAGEGGPVIAILGEYDALPGLSQEAGIAEHREIEPGGHGHGCGHNLLGSAALLAATAVKDWLAENKLPGRVRYYGCPAEEGGAAKAFMVRAGAFDDIDIAISWHPSSFWEVTPALSLANTRADFIFAGRGLARGGSAASRSQRARCGGIDECRRQLHARAHAERCPRALRAARHRRDRAQRGAGPCPRALLDPRDGFADHAFPGRAREEDRRGRGADDRDQDDDADHQRGVELRRQSAARAPCKA